MELHPVVMAAGRGTRLTDLTYSCPRALLPIGNVPSVCYPIAMLEKSGFDEALVVVPEEYLSAIRSAVENVFTGTIRIRLTYFGIQNSEALGTADTLRCLKDKISSDMLILSCDLVTDISIHKLIDIHRTYNSTCTLLLSAVSQQFYDAPTPGIKTKQKMERDVVGVDESGTRLLFFSSESDLDESISLRKPLLNQYDFV